MHVCGMALWHALALHDVTWHWHAHCMAFCAWATGRRLGVSLSPSPTSHIPLPLFPLRQKNCRQQTVLTAWQTETEDRTDRNRQFFFFSFLHHGMPSNLFAQMEVREKVTWDRRHLGVDCQDELS